MKNVKKHFVKKHLNERINKKAAVCITAFLMLGIVATGCIDDTDIISANPDYNGASENISCESATPCPEECRYYVDISGDDTADGLGWATAMRQVQPAINRAFCTVQSCAGIHQCDVWVAGLKRADSEGSAKDYSMKTSNVARNDTIRLRDGINLYGGFEGTETTADDRWFVQERPAVGVNEWAFGTYLPHLGGNGRTMEVDGRGRIDGFSFSGASLDVDGGKNAAPGGGAIWAHGNTVTIANCEFADNGGRIGGMGGAVMVDGGDAHISYSVFRNNIGHNGGALGLTGGAIVVDRCVFHDNEADFMGGAIYKLNAESLDIRNSIFSGNHASKWGGAVYATSWGPESNFDYTPESNSLTVTNSFFVANQAAAGSAVIADGQAEVIAEQQIKNCTFYNNVDTQGYGAIQLVGTGLDGIGEIVNSIVWSDTSLDAPLVYAARVSHSVLINLGALSEEVVQDANIDANPLIQVVSSGDWQSGWSYTLAPDSPCIDAGQGDMAPSVDLLGNPRTDIATVANTGSGVIDYADIGAIEFVDVSSTP